MDMIEGPYVSQFRNTDGSLFSAQWVEVTNPKAIVFQLPTIFRSGRYSPDMPYDNDLPGEVVDQNYQRPAIKRVPDRVCPNCWVGSDGWWLGFPSTAPPVHIAQDGFAAECGGFPKVKRGGVGLLKIGGSSAHSGLGYHAVGGLALGSVSTPPLPLNSGGLLLGGSSTVERLLTPGIGGLAVGGRGQPQPFPVAKEGGLLLGGTSTAFKDAYAVSGGLLLGGTASEKEQLARSGGLKLGGTASEKEQLAGSGGLKLGGTFVGLVPETDSGGLSLGGTSTHSGLIIFDQMTGSAASMAGRTPDTVDVPGNNWVNITNGHAVDGSGFAIRDSAGGAIPFTTIDTTHSDCSVQCAITTLGAHPIAGLVVRASDAANYFAIELVDTSVNPNTFYLFKFTGGTLTVLADYNLGQPVAGHSYLVKCIMSGSSFNVYLDGTLRLTASDSFNSTVTKHGIRSIQNVTFTGGKFKNFVVF